MKNKPGILRINEIFFSIQGESSQTGRPCVFVRLTYCNLRCTYCDTTYAFYEGTEMHLDDIVEKIQTFDCPLVEITGGEPLLQANVHQLAARLCESGFEVMIETGGHMDISKLDKRVKRIMDIKCPSSRESEKILWKNIDFLSGADEVKFVIGDYDDYTWAKNIVRKHRLDKKCTVLFSPVFDKMNYRDLAENILRDRLPVRMQLQIHKFIWSPETRGV